MAWNRQNAGRALRRNLRMGRDQAHGVFSHRRDGQAGVDAWIARHDRAINDVEAGVFVRLEIQPEDTFFRVRAKGTAAEHVRADGTAKHTLANRTDGKALHLAGKAPRDRVRW